MRSYAVWVRGAGLTEGPMFRPGDQAREHRNPVAGDALVPLLRGQDREDPSPGSERHGVIGIPAGAGRKALRWPCQCSLNCEAMYKG